MLALIGFTYVLGLFTIIQDLLRFHHRKTLFLIPCEKLFFGPPDLNQHKNKFKMCGVRQCPTFCFFGRDFQNVVVCKNNMFLGVCVCGCLVFFEVFW